MLILSREHGDALEAAAQGAVVVVANEPRGCRVIPVSVEVFEAVEEALTGIVRRPGDEWVRVLPCEDTTAEAP